MTGDTELAREFEAQRPRLVRLAYASTGSLAEAEDCVQEAWLRLQRAADRAAIRDLGAWLTTTVSRLALDALSSAKARRERQTGPWLPEPLVEHVGDAGALGGVAGDPAERVTLDESVSMALLVVLETLSPAERTAFLLHDVFGMSFDEVAEVVGRSAAAVRQLASRARRHVRDDRPRFPPTRRQQAELLGAFTSACADGDLERLLALLDPDVVWRADGGGKVRAVPALARGAAQIARLLLGYARRPPTRMRAALVNGAPGLVLRDADGILTVMAMTVDAGRITAIDVVRDPDKLTALRRLDDADRPAELGGALSRRPAPFRIKISFHPSGRAATRFRRFPPRRPAWVRRQRRGLASGAPGTPAPPRVRRGPGWRRGRSARRRRR
jgi:RNA polymerase sigma-70 factor, ECF subfamily